MSPSPRAVVVLGVLALSALVVPPGLALLGVVALLGAVAVDMAAARRAPAVERTAPTVLARGVAAHLVVEGSAPGAVVAVRQPVPPDLRVEPTDAVGRLEATLTPLRRGRHVLPAPVARTTGPLGLGRWDHRVGEPAEVAVYPDLPAARRLATAVRFGQLREQGRLTRGALGLGTDFESMRDYSPDDDIRQVNWRATARLERPMSNQYRLDQDRDVLCVVDCGRLMTAPVTPRTTRLDIALDAVAAVALVADEVGDRCGAVAFDSAIRRQVRPRRAGGRAVVDALFDVEPTSVDSDYELAFHTVGGAKRSLVLVLTDLLEESAARPLVDAVPVLARRHVVVVASVTDPDLAGLLRTPPANVADGYAASVAVDVLEARAVVAAQLRTAGAEVVEAPPAGLAHACVSAYLRMKAMARL
ncbi:MAG TPA: DUF58 domain-containing protein [Acidimicrobiales bacterium]|nr:DUF58 domain-containing protein [Acidimicrobiales bacterium]